MSRWIQRLALAVVTTLLLLTATPVVRWWALWLSAGWTERPRPVIVVLAGETIGDGSIGYSTYLRCLYAWWAYRAGGVETLVLAGGPEVRPVSRAMGDFLSGLGVPRERMQTETRSNNTRENLANVRTLLGQRRSITLLTSDYHMRRALLLAAREGLDAAPYPVPDILKREATLSQRASLAVPLAEETAKYWWELFSSWSSLS